MLVKRALDEMQRCFRSGSRSWSRRAVVWMRGLWRKLLFTAAVLAAVAEISCVHRGVPRQPAAAGTTWS